MKSRSPFKLHGKEEVGESGPDPDDVAARKGKGAPFYTAKGSDQNAAMKGDFAQQVPRSTAPAAKPKRPKVKSGGAYKLSATRPKTVAPAVPRVKMNA
jgi:hypothetical protein